MTSETRPLLLAKCASIGEKNKAQPSNIYSNSRLLDLKWSATFQACSPSSDGAKPNLFCYAATEVAHKPGGADLRPPHTAAAEAMPRPDVKLTLQVLHRYKSPAVTAHILKIEHRRSWQ